MGMPQLYICLYGPQMLHVDLKFVAPEALAKRVEEPVVLWDRTGAVRAGYAEILEGVEPGDVVVSKGVTRVVDGAEVQIVPADPS